MAKPRKPPLASRAELEELAAVYREVDEAYASYRCEGTTECCRFAITGREPYVTSIELAGVERAIAAGGGPLSPRRRALPLYETEGFDEEHTCPLLDRQARCSIYAWRPLGCRTFYCHRAETEAPVSQARLNELVRKVRELADRHQPNGGQGRPLVRALRPR
jgi:uncharacterized protein